MVIASSGSLPPISYGSGLQPGTISLPGIETILLFVDKAAVTGFEDGSRQNPFHVVANALVAAAALTPGAARHVVLMIYPGEYAEDGLNSVDYVYWVGVGGRDAVRIEGDSATVLTVDDEHTSYWGITFANTGAFRPLQVSGAMASSTQFVECAFRSSLDSNSPYVAVLDTAQVEFKDCAFSNASSDNRMFVTQGTPTVVLDGCDVEGHFDLQGGDFHLINSCVDTTSASYLIRVFGHLMQGFFIESCELRSQNNHCILFSGVPTTDVVIRNNTLVAGAGYDVGENGGAVAGFVIEGNIMSRGIQSSVSHVKSERNVGQAGDMDFYATLQDALDSCTFDDIVVRMLKDEVVVGASLTFPSYTIVVDGNGKHTLTAPAGGLLAFLSSGDDTTLRDIKIIGSIYSTGTGILLTIKDSEMVGAVSLGPTDATTIVKIRSSQIVGDAARLYAVLFGDADPTVIVEHSYLKGNSGSPAVYWNIVTNNNLKMRHSKCFHGSLGANNPFGASGVQTPNWRGYQNDFNADPGSFAGPPNWTNLVAAGQQQSSFDVNTDFF